MFPQKLLDLEMELQTRLFPAVDVVVYVLQQAHRLEIPDFLDLGLPFENLVLPVQGRLQLVQEFREPVQEPIPERQNQLGTDPAGQAHQVRVRATRAARATP
jgi:hypothetical protein